VWPDLKLVSFQRAAIWGIAIQAYLLNAPGIYTELETWRVTLAEEAAAAVSTGAIPGCAGSVVEVLLCITGTSPAEVLYPSLTALPDQIPCGQHSRQLREARLWNPTAPAGPPHPPGSTGPSASRADSCSLRTARHPRRDPRRGRCRCP
jgi:hypothetical protein